MVVYNRKVVGKRMCSNKKRLFPVTLEGNK